MDLNEELAYETINEIYHKYFAGVSVLEGLDICSSLTLLVLLNFSKEDREIYATKSFCDVIEKLKMNSAI